MKTVTFLLSAGALAATAASYQSSSPPPPFGPVVAPGRTLTTADMINPNPLLPADLYRNANNSVAHADAATFAWLSFISAVSPARPGARGAPGGSFAQSGAQSGSPPLVWETYQHRTELLPCNVAGGNAAPAPPQPWGAPPKYVITKMGSNPQVCNTLPLGLPFNNLDEANQIGQNSLFYPINPASPNPATDWQVLFEARVNQVESDWVRGNYQSLNPQFPAFHFSPGISLPDGTFEVKAAWRPITSIAPNQRYRYHTATVVTYAGSDANPRPVTQVYALIALHLIHKTPNYPAFVFATFEQVDDLNNQAQGGSPTGVYYVPSYNAVGYDTPGTTTFPPNGDSVINPDIGFTATKPTAKPLGGGTVNLPIGAVTGFPGAKVVGGLVTIPVTQPVPLVSDVAKVNQQALNAMRGIPGFNQNFVWQYYRLAGVQAIPTSDETTRDFYLANIVVESSQPGIQLFRGFPPISPAPFQPALTNIRNQVNVVDNQFSPGSQNAMGGCQGCHGVAQTQNGFDFSFLFFGAGGGGFSPETVGIVSPAAGQVRLQAKGYATAR